ncbi:MAG: hypothetical protein IT443_10310 [Phycisphaeraceae bacterium]|nr:hypothetical protein [Phycisphaeraceae bacterium]
MFHKTLSSWAVESLIGPKTIQWPAADPAADFRSHDWSFLYQGSVLDD